MSHPLSPARRGPGDGDDAHALTGPYAVDALDPDERAAVERHLDACPACRDEVRELRETAARLAATTAVTPPDRLRARVMAEIGGVRQIPPVTRPAAPTPRSRRRSASPFAAPSARLPWLAAAAMFVAAVVLGALLLDAREQSDGRSDRIAAVVTAPDARTALAESGAARATVIESRYLDRAVVVAAGLPDPGPEHDYQVWFMADGSVRSAGLLGDAAAGTRTSGLVADGLGDATRIGVTREPAGGSPAPTTEPMLLVTLPV